MVTLKDVAKKANVSPSTVSRVMSNSKDISENTRKKVTKIMDELGYVPNITARKLVTNQSNTIGLVLKTISIEMRQNPFFTEVLTSISSVCEEKRFSTIMTTSYTSEDLLNEVKALVLSKAVDGFILLYSMENDPIYKYLVDNEVPFVVIGKKINNDPNVMFVDNDNIEASYNLTKYMSGLGHRSLLFLSENNTYEVNKDRLTGFLKACKEDNIQHKYVNEVVSRDEITNLLINEDIRKNYTGIVTTDSMLNLNLLSALYKLNVNIPDDIQTCTFTDSYLSESACPPQTVVNIYPENLGKIAAKSLLEILQKEDAVMHSSIIPTSIIERDSTKQLKS